MGGRGCAAVVPVSRHQQLAPAGHEHNSKRVLGGCLTIFGYRVFPSLELIATTAMRGYIELTLAPGAGALLAYTMAWIGRSPAPVAVLKAPADVDGAPVADVSSPSAADSDILKKLLVLQGRS